VSTKVPLKSEKAGKRTSASKTVRHTAPA
jgi:hypothetical protein